MMLCVINEKTLVGHSLKKTVEHDSKLFETIK